MANFYIFFTNVDIGGFFDQSLISSSEKIVFVSLIKLVAFSEALSFGHFVLDDRVGPLELDHVGRMHLVMPVLSLLKGATYSILNRLKVDLVILREDRFQSVESTNDSVRREFELHWVDLSLVLLDAQLAKTIYVPCYALRVNAFASVDWAEAGIALLAETRSLFSPLLHIAAIRWTVASFLACLR